MKVNWSLLENIGSLLTVKGLQYILSFITFPYLVRVLHVDGFGQLAFATGVVQYFYYFLTLALTSVDLKVLRAMIVGQRGAFISVPSWGLSSLFSPL